MPAVITMHMTRIFLVVFCCTMVGADVGCFVGLLVAGEISDKSAPSATTNVSTAKPSASAVAKSLVGPARS